jgi:hypothetical protein
MDKQVKKIACEKFRASLREQMEESQISVRAIQQTSGKERESAWDQKRCVGRDTRYILLAYAFLRGVPYKVLESFTAGGNEPSFRSIAYAGLSVAGLAFDEDAICAWLNGEKPAEILVPIKAEEPKPVKRAAPAPDPGLLKKVAAFFGVGT